MSKLLMLLSSRQCPGGGGPPASAPVVAALPQIMTDGTPEQGEVVTATTGSWLYVPTSYTYQWKRNGTNIGGATSANYTLQVADNNQSITVAVTATNTTGSNTASSLGITPTAGGGGGFSPSMDFTDSRNSQYVGAIL